MLGRSSAQLWVGLIFAAFSLAWASYNLSSSAITGNSKEDESQRGTAMDEVVDKEKDTVCAGESACVCVP